MINRLWPYVLGSVALGLDAYVIAGMLPTIAADLGSSPGQVGLGVAAFTGAYAVTGPLLAGVAGRRASRSLLLALGLFVGANLASALASSVAVFIATRLLAGAAAGIYSPLSSAVAAASVEAERKGRALSLVLAGLACGTVFGVPLGLLIAQRSSWRWTFALIAGVGGVAAAGVALRGRGRVANVASPSLAARLATLGRVANVLTMLVTLLTGVASLGLYTYFVPLVEGLGLAAHQTWLIWVWGAGGALGALAVGHVVDAVSRPVVLTAVITVGLGVAFVLVGWNLPLVMTAVGIFLWGMLGWSSLAPQQHMLMSANPHDGTTAVAANASANYLGSALGSVVGAALIDHRVTGGALAWVAVGPCLVACVVQLFRIRMDRLETAPLRHPARSSGTCGPNDESQ